MNSNKQKLGQFYTKNSKFITEGLLDVFPKSAKIIDPFAGEFDLLNLFPNNETLGYDIDPKIKGTIKQNTLLNPPNFSNSWVITNPPYLAKNKNKDKFLYEKFELDDYYKIAIKTIIGCNGGLIIVPVNFFSSLNSKIREEFLSKYVVKKVNVFQERVFKDTSYTVCAFSFVKEENVEQKIQFNFFPEKEKKIFSLKKKEKYTFGNEIYELKVSKVKVGRLLIGQKPTSNLFLSAVDTGSKDGKLGLKIVKEYYYGKSTDRAFATISLSKNFTIKEQEKIVKIFNDKLNYFRQKYNSLFLPNYRDKYRKRIPFKLAYFLISYAITQL